MVVYMKSARPLYIGGEVVTEFGTNEAHARELEARGFAERVSPADADAVKPPVERLAGATELKKRTKAG